MSSNDVDIKNDQGQDMKVHILTPDNFRPDEPRVVFLEHGRSGRIMYKHNHAVAMAYLNQGWRVIGLNAGNSQNNAIARLEAA